MDRLGRPTHHRLVDGEDHEDDRALVADSQVRQVGRPLQQLCEVDAQLRFDDEHDGRIRLPDEEDHIGAIFDRHHQVGVRGADTDYRVWRHFGVADVLKEHRQQVGLVAEQFEDDFVC